MKRFAIAAVAILAVGLICRAQLPYEAALRATLDSSAGPPTLPTGAVGVWYADQYDATKKAIPNSVSALPVSTNVLRAPRHLFNETQHWGKNSLTVTDGGFTDPFGGTEASRVVGGANVWQLNCRDSPTFTAGTYTMAVWVKSNTGSSQTFRMSFVGGGGTSVTQTATTSWQRFTLTSTLTSAAITTYVIRDPDGATAGDLLICDAEVFPGSSDLGAGANQFGGHLYFGTTSFDASSAGSYASGAMSMVNGFGITQFSSAVALNSFTVVSMAAKTTTASAYNTIIGKAQDFNAFAAMWDQSKSPYFAWGGSLRQFPQSGVQEVTGLVGAPNSQWHTITNRYDGTTGAYWVDDVKLASGTFSGTNPSVTDAWVGEIVSTGFRTGYKFNSIALWNRALSDAEVKTAVGVLQTRAAVSSISTTPARILVVDGDSISNDDPSHNYVGLFGPNSNPSVYGFNFSTGGATLSTLVARESTIDTVLTQQPTSGRKFIFHVCVGRNDLVTAGAASQLLTDLAAYCDRKRAEGYLVVVGTLEADINANVTAQRGTVNTAIRTWTTAGSIHADAIADYASDSIMGDDAQASASGGANTYFKDGTHPTAAGHVLREPYMRAAVNSL